MTGGPEPDSAGGGALSASFESRLAHDLQQAAERGQLLGRAARDIAHDAYGRFPVLLTNL